MAKALHTVIVQTTKLALDKVKFFVSFLWWSYFNWQPILAINSFMYTIQNWTIVPMLLSLKHVVDGFNVTNLIIVIMQSTICGNGGIFYTNVNFL